MSQKAAALLVDSLAAKLLEKQRVTFMPSAGGRTVTIKVK